MIINASAKTLSRRMVITKDGLIIFHRVGVSCCECKRVPSHATILSRLISQAVSSTQSQSAPTVSNTQSVYKISTNCQHTVSQVTKSAHTVSRHTSANEVTNTVHREKSKPYTRLHTQVMTSQTIKLIR